MVVNYSVSSVKIVTMTYNASVSAQVLEVFEVQSEKGYEVPSSAWTITDVLVLAVFVLMGIAHFWRREQDNLKVKKKWLPGPRSIPILGSLPFMMPYLLRNPKHKLVEAINKVYGKVWGLQFGVHYCVLISDIEVAKRVMTSDDWINRFPDHAMFYERSFNKSIGLGLANGENWRQMRKYSIRTLRQFGFGKHQTMEGSIKVELEQVVKKVEGAIESNGGILNAQQFFYVPLLNVLWTMMAGVRFHYDDEKLRALLRLGEEVCKMAPQGTTPMFAFPFLRKIPYLTEHDMVLKLHHYMQDLFRGILEERRAAGTYLEDPQDFMDVFLRDIENFKGTEKEQYFTDEQFIMVCNDLFFGINSVSAAMEFSIMYMILNPRVQQKVQAELDRVVGGARAPSLADKSSLPYAEATMYEVLRVANILPLTGRCPVADTELDGHFVPKGTIVGIDLKSIHMDTDIWPDAQEFRPERFLNDDGTKLANLEKTLLFGHGTRFCIADVLAKSSVFLFFITLMQKYSFEPSPAHRSPNPVPLPGFSQNPVPFHAFVQKRPDFQ